MTLMRLVWCLLSIVFCLCAVKMTLANEDGSLLTLCVGLLFLLLSKVE